MQKLLLLAAALLMSTAFFGFAGEIEIIKNPEHPGAKNAGRIVELEEVFRISDESGDFYLKHPGRIKPVPNGGFFVLDEKEFLFFGKEGKFIDNQFKKGQGPGEYEYILGYYFLDNKIIILTSQPHKIIATDLKGNLLKEHRVDLTMRFFRERGFFKGNYWFSSAKVDFYDKKNKGNIDINHELSYVTPAGEIKKTDLCIPEKWYLENNTNNGKGGFSLKLQAAAKSVMDGAGNLFVMNSREYLVQRIELEKAKVVAKFSRKYHSVLYREEATKKKRKTIGPRPKYFADIQKLLIHGNRLWVLTSTVTSGKGVLVDVFSKEGKYLDNFYLPLPQVKTVHDIMRKIRTISGEFLFTVETDEDENPVIVKYGIIDKQDFRRGLDI